MTYKIGTSHQCRKCGGPVIAQEADDEVKRLRDELAKAQLAEARRLLSAALHTIEFLATEDPAAPRKDMLRWVRDARALIRRV